MLISISVHLSRDVIRQFKIEPSRRPDYRRISPPSYVFAERLANLLIRRRVKKLLRHGACREEGELTAESRVLVCAGHLFNAGKL